MHWTAPEQEFRWQFVIFDAIEVENFSKSTDEIFPNSLLPVVVQRIFSMMISVSHPFYVWLYRSLSDRHAKIVDVRPRWNVDWRQNCTLTMWMAVNIPIDLLPSHCRQSLSHILRAKQKKNWENVKNRANKYSKVNAGKCKQINNYYLLLMLLFWVDIFWKFHWLLERQ